MSKIQKKKLIVGLISLFFVIILLIGLGRYSYSVMSRNAVPASYMITAENYFDYQKGQECSAYSSSYALRSMGAEIDGLTLYDKIEKKNVDGTVNPDILSTTLTKEGYTTRMSDDSTIKDLKQQVSKGVPVIVLIRLNMVQGYLHYVPVVGYDEEYIYIADSLSSMVNEEENEHYNRKVKTEDFEDL